jgi:hypothetical protein
MTAISGAVFAAADFNRYVRDNLNETAVAKATAASQLFVSTGANALAVRVPSQQTVLTSETSASASYTNLATTGPLVTVTTGTIAIVAFAATSSNSSTNSATYTSVGVTGASSVVASDNWCILNDGVAATNASRFGVTHFFTGLTPGSNTFTMKYKAGSGTGTWLGREISVLPL